MGGVPGTLLCFWCKGGCSTAKVAGALTFFPPEPNYSVSRDESTKKLKFVVNPDLEPIPFERTEVVILTTKKKRSICAVLYTAPGAKYTILYSHGNATDLGAMHDRYVGLVDNLRTNVLAYDYTGYGQSSQVVCTEADTYADIEAVYEWAIKNVCPSPAEQIILYGQSVGSGPTCFLGSKYEVAGVILHSPFLSGMRVLTESRALACLDIFPNINRIQKLKCPAMIIHGKEDQEVDWSHGVGLYNAIPDHFKRDPWWVPGRGHNNIVQGTAAVAEYYRRLNNFLGSLKGDTPPVPTVTTPPPVFAGTEASNPPVEATKS